MHEQVQLREWVGGLGTICRSFKFKRFRPVAIFAGLPKAKSRARPISHVAGIKKVMLQVQLMRRYGDKVTRCIEIFNRPSLVIVAVRYK